MLYQSFTNWPISGITTCTTSIEAMQNGQIINYSSGFFYEYRHKKFLVLNRHVIIDEHKDYYADSINIYLHNSLEDIKSIKKVTINLYENNKPVWFEHPEYTKFLCDIILIPVGYKYLEGCVLNFINESFYLNVMQLSGFSEVIVIGYPHGIFDNKNKLPVYRKGLIASQHPFNYYDKPCFLVDTYINSGMTGGLVMSAPSNVLIDDCYEREIRVPHSVILGILSEKPLFTEETKNLYVVWYGELIKEILSCNF